MTLVTAAIAAKWRLHDGMSDRPRTLSRLLEGAPASGLQWRQRVAVTRLFAVSAEIGAALVAAADAYPIDGAILHADEVPSPDGFIYFERPVEPSGEHAMIWHTIGDRITMAAFVPPGHDRAMEASSALVVWRLGSAYRPNALEDLRAMAAPNPFAGHGDAFPFKLIATFFAFIRQRIFLTSTERAQRQVRRSLSRQGKNGDEEVQVIVLRQAASRGDAAAEARTVEWGCRWIVAGHWVNQWYPSRQRHERIWLMPYVKGPEDKPLRISDKVWAVTR